MNYSSEQVSIVRKVNEIDGIYVFENEYLAGRFATQCEANGCEIEVGSAPLLGVDGTAHLLEAEKTSHAA